MTNGSEASTMSSSQSSEGSIRRPMESFASTSGEPRAVPRSEIRSLDSWSVGAGGSIAARLRLDDPEDRLRLQVVPTSR
jgi:hypothetical protein